MIESKAKFNGGIFRRGTEKKNCLVSLLEITSLRNKIF